MNLKPLDFKSINLKFKSKSKSKFLNRTYKYLQCIAQVAYPCFYAWYFTRLQVINFTIVFFFTAIHFNSSWSCQPS